MNIEQIKHRIGNIAIMCDENDKEQLDILVELLALINDINIESIETVKDVPSADGDLKAEIDKLPRIKVGNSNSPTVKYCIDERLLYEILEKMKGE